VPVESCLEVVDRQSNQKLNLNELKQGDQICPTYTGYMWFGSWICPVQQDNMLHKSRSGVKTMNLDPDKVTTSKQDTI
jgi:hypothetical protein